MHTYHLMECQDFSLVFALSFIFSGPLVEMPNTEKFFFDTSRLLLCAICCQMWTDWFHFKNYKNIPNLCSGPWKRPWIILTHFDEVGCARFLFVCLFSVLLYINTSLFWKSLLALGYLILFLYQIEILRLKIHTSWLNLVKVEVYWIPLP